MSPRVRSACLPMLLFVAGATACPDRSDRDEAPAAAEGAATRPQPPASESKVAEEKPATAAACTDWSKFDVGTLPPLPAGEYEGILDEVWRRVLDQHYDPTLGCLDWPAVRAEYGARLEGVRDRSEAYRIVNEMLQKLEQSHFHLFDPGAAGDEALGPTSPPLKARWIEDALVVVESEVDAVPAGATIVAIDGEPFSSALDGARRRAAAGVASVHSLISRAAAARLSCLRAGETRVLTIEPVGGARRDETIQCQSPQGERISMGNLANVPTVVEHRVVETGGTKIGVLAFNIWMLPMVERVKNALSELRAAGITGLVIDLRGNPGGVGPMSVPVARLILQDSASLGKLQLRDFSQNFMVEGNPDAFTGPVALLVDEGTASTSEIFAAGLRDLGRVQIFGGGPSAGAALPSVIEELDGGALLQYVVGDYHSPHGTVVEGDGIVPDVVVPETREKFAAGEDPVLDVAVKYLAEGKGT